MPPPVPLGDENTEPGAEGRRQSDPRSFIVRKTADEVFKVTGKDELLETAMALHDAAMRDEYFIKRKLAPNVDFWCVFASLPPALRRSLTEHVLSQEVSHFSGVVICKCSSGNPPDDRTSAVRHFHRSDRGDAHDLKE